MQAAATIAATACCSPQNAVNMTPPEKMGKKIF